MHGSCPARCGMGQPGPRKALRPDGAHGYPTGTLLLGPGTDRRAVGTAVHPLGCPAGQSRWPVPRPRCHAIPRSSIGRASGC